MNYDKLTASLADDGTLDTIVNVYDVNGYIVNVARWSQDGANDYRDENGSFTDEGLKELLDLTIMFTIDKMLSQEISK